MSEDPTPTDEPAAGQSEPTPARSAKRTSTPAAGTKPTAAEDAKELGGDGAARSADKTDMDAVGDDGQVFGG